MRGKAWTNEVADVTDVTEVTEVRLHLGFFAISLSVDSHEVVPRHPDEREDAQEDRDPHGGSRIRLRCGVRIGRW